MTNADKFEEVFGIKIDKYSDDLCNIADHEICVNQSRCKGCPLYLFLGKGV